MANNPDARMELGLSRAEISDLGNSFGLEASYFIKSNVRARLSYSLLSYENRRTLGSIQFTEAVDQANARISLDWFPAISWVPQQGVFTSTGVTNMRVTATLKATADHSLNYTIIGVAYTVAQLGKITGTVETQNDKFENNYTLYGLTVGYRF